MENAELKYILIAYKSTNIGLQEAHDEIIKLFDKKESGPCKHPREKRTYIGSGYLKCGICGEEFK